ncbi:MAG: restriction endonuclease subunit S [Candidatus Methanoperedens sp.]|nr:restriction endonuclease subunit S [Candidatus Methanoperedens sp.]
MVSEWKEYKLSEIMEINGGGTPKTSMHEYWNGDIPWLSVVDFNNGRKLVFDTEKKITEKGLQESSTKVLKKGQIIISARGTVGALAVLGKDMAFNQSCYGLNAKEDLTFNDYLYYLVKDNVSSLLNNTHGAVFDTITRETFDHISVELPTVPEQQSIGSILSSLDDKIDLLHRQNKTLEALAETLFRQWFVEEAEEGGKVGSMEDEFDFTMGQSPPGSSYNEDGNGLVFFQGRTDFGFRFPEPRVYTTEPKRLAKRFDTLVSVRAPVGDMNMALQDCCLGRGVAAFRYKYNPSFTTYTYYKLRSLMAQIKQFEDNGTVFGSIGKDDFKELENIIPPKELIQTFQSEAAPLDEKILNNTIQILTLTRLRDMLLPKLISGEVRVKSG